MQHYKKILGRCYNCEKSGHLTQDYKKRIDKDLKQNWRKEDKNDDDENTLEKVVDMFEANVDAMEIEGNQPWYFNFAMTKHHVALISE